MKKNLLICLMAVIDIAIAATTATAQTHYTYIDETGHSTEIDENVSVTEIAGTMSSTLTDGWYYVSSASSMTGDLEISGDVKLILDKDLTIDGKIEIPSGSSLTIYGTTNLLYKQATLYVDDDINAAGTLIINSCLKVDTHDIGSDAATISILGGQVSAEAISAANLTLGYKSMDDKIVCSSITANAITIAEGCSYQLDGNTYSGELSPEEITNFCAYVANLNYDGIGKTSEVFEEGIFSYTILDDGKSVQVSGLARGVTAPENLTIPSSVQHGGTTYPVTKIGGYAFTYPSNVSSYTKNVTIPGTIVEIKENAFANCSALETVEVEGNGLKFIGDYAFYYISLKEITLPASIEYIGASAFENCFNDNGLTVYCNAVNPPELGENALNAIYYNTCYIYIPPCADYSNSGWQDFFGSKIYGYVPFDQTGLDGTYDKEFDGSVDVLNFTPVTLTPVDGVTLTFTKLEFADPNVELDDNSSTGYKAKTLMASYDLKYSANESCNTTGNEIRLKEVSATITPHEITQDEIESVIKSRRTPITDDYYAYAKAGHYEGSNNGKLDGNYTTTVVLFPENPAKTVKFRLNAYYVIDESSTAIVTSDADAKYIHVETNTDGFRNKDNYETHNYAFANSYENFSGAIGNFQPYVERSADELTFKYDILPTDASITYYTFPDADNAPDWDEAGNKTNITKVVFDPFFKDAAPTSCLDWFNGFEILTTIQDIQYLNTADVTRMDGMFASCKALQAVDVSHFDTKSVINMKDMFASCELLETIDVSHFNTEYVQDMSYMFNGCSSLTSLDFGSNFKTFRVTNMESMFNGCSSLTSLDLRSFNTKNVMNMYNMFAYCSKLTGILVNESTWSTVKVTDINSGLNLFVGCPKLIGDQGTIVESIEGDERWHFTYARVDDPANGHPGYLTKDKFKIFYKGINNSNTYEGAVTEYESAVSLVPPTKRSSTFVGWTGPGITEPTEDVSTPSTGAGNLTYTAHWDKEAYVVYNEHILTFYYDGLRYSRQSSNTFDIEDTYSNGDSPAWEEVMVNNYYPLYVKQVTFDDSFKEFRPVNCSHWFDCTENSDPNLDKMSQLQSINGLENLNTEDVTDMSYMFCRVKFETIDVSHFNTGKVTNMKGLFYDCEKLTNIVGLSNFNTAKVTDMSYMFAHCYRLTSFDISLFNTAQVTDMSYMFNCVPAEVLYLGSFNTEQVANMECMFALKSNKITVNNVLTTIYVDQNNWKLTNCSNSADMFYGRDRLKGGAGTSFNSVKVDKEYARIDNPDSGLPGYLTSSSSTDHYYAIFHEDPDPNDDSKTIKTLTFKKGARDASIIGDYYDLVSINTKGPGWQVHKTEVEVVNIADVIKPTSCDLWFYEFKKLTTIKNIDNLDLSNATSVYSMFRDCESLELSFADDSPFLSKTEKVEDFSYMFSGCKSLGKRLDESPDQIQPLNMTVLNTTSATSFKGMFNKCENVEEIKGVENFKSGADVSYMFSQCEKLKSINVSGLVTNNNTTLSSVFSGCKFLTVLDLSTWNTSGVRTMGYLFEGCESLTTILVGTDWNTDKVYNSPADYWAKLHVFEGCSNLIGNAGTLYNEDFYSAYGENEDIVFAHIDDPDNDNPGYLTTGNYKIFYDLASDDGVPNLATASELASAFATTSPAVTEFAHGADKSINNPKDLTGNPFKGWTGAGITEPTKNLVIAADDPGNRIYTANWTKNRDAYAVYDDTDGKNTLTFYFDANKPDAGSFALNTADKEPDWGSKNADVLKVVFDDSFQGYFGVTSCYQWFKGFSKLTALDLRNLKTSNVTNMESMFDGCSNLTGILVDDDWSTDNVTESENMFTGCTSLIGEGENFVPDDVDYQDKTYAYAGETYYGYGYLTQDNFKIFYHLNDFDENGDDGDAQFSDGDEYNDRTENCSDAEETTLETPTWDGHIFSGWSKVTGYDFDEYEYLYDTEEPLHQNSVSPGSGNMVLFGLWDKNYPITLPDGDWELTDEFGRELPKDSNENPTAPKGAKIIIKYTGSKKLKEVKVYPMPTSISITQPSSTTLSVDGQITLIATISPTEGIADEDKVVTWSSSDEEVATVSEDGEVTAVAAGEATITATTTNGKTATIEITVN